MEEMLEAITIPVGEEPAVPTAPIGLNRPLRVEISEIFTGYFDAGEVLVTSAVKSAATYNASPLAVHAVHKFKGKGGGRRQYLPFRAATNGTNIVYYSPAALDRSLLIDLRLDFDRFDQDRYNKYVDVLAKTAGLPVFLGASAVGGPGGGAAAAAAIYATSTTVKVLFRAFDRWRDATNDADLYATVKLQVEDGSSVRSDAGYYLCWSDDAPMKISPSNTWTDSTLAGEGTDEFAVNRQGQLIYKDNGHRVDNVDRGYVLLHISGTESPELEKFEPTAATAALLAKFVGSEGSLVEDFGELAQAYNVFVFIQQISRIDAGLKSAKSDEQKAKLSEQRSAVLKHIRSNEVKDLLEPAVV